MITTFDRPDYLAECLASVKQQTLTGFRLVVLDNASAADYAGVLHRFRDLPMTYVRNETNIGAAGNIEKAMRLYSDSRYLVVFHDDDQMHPRMLEWQLDVIERDPEIQFVSTELATFEDGDGPFRDTWENVSRKLEVYGDESDLARSLLRDGGLCFGSTMYRSSVLQRIRLDEPRFSIIWDRPFLMDAARLGKSALLRSPLVLYRHHPGQDTNTGQLTAKNLIELMKAYRQALPVRWNRADQQVFYSYGVYFLIHYGYARLSENERVGAGTFIRKAIQLKILRLRDISLSDVATMMRMDGRRALPALLTAAHAAKQRLSPSRWAARVRQQSARETPPPSHFEK